MGCCGGGRRAFSFTIELLTGEKFTVGSADGLTTRMKCRNLLDHIFRHLSIASRYQNEKDFLGLKFPNPYPESYYDNPPPDRVKISYLEPVIHSWKTGIDWKWMDPSRPISEYLKGQVPMNHLYISVRYYVSDPTRLLDDNTRTQFYLQLRQNLLTGELPLTSQRDSAELSALIAQIEHGDFDKDWKLQSKKLAASASNSSLPDYSSIAIGVNDSRGRRMTSEYDRYIYRAHKDLIGLTITEAQMRFLWKCHKLPMYGVRRFKLAGDRRLWLGMSPKGINLYEVIPSKNPKVNNPIGVTEPLEKLDRIGLYSWMSITQIDYCDKLFEVHHTASTQLGSTDM